MENQTTDSKKKTTKEAVQDRIALLLSGVHESMKGHLEKMKINYRWFFECYAEPMYLDDMRRLKLELLSEEIEKWDGEDLSKYLLDKAQQIINEIARYSLERYSISQIRNIAYALNLRAKQVMIDDLEWLASIAAQAE